jgi:hypothetical protein
MKITDLAHGEKFKQITSRATTELNRCGGLSHVFPSNEDIDRELLESVLCLTLNYGWRGLLSLVGNVALFTERSDVGGDFRNEYGLYDVAAIILLLQDSIRRGDRSQIRAAIVALGGQPSD